MFDPALKAVPKHGEWPVDPQEDIEVSKDRIWIDGCFDFSHHGHAGAMLQARRLGRELFVGVHSDREILDNKGPTVMTLEERLDAGRFLVVKRTPGISTTDLVGRMLLCTKAHFIRSLTRVLSGNEGPGSAEEKRNAGTEMSQRIKDYASDETGLQPGALVCSWIEPTSSSQTSLTAELGSCKILVDGVHPKPGQRLVYVDGGFDLFSSGHIEFLRQVVKTEEALGRKTGWYDDASIHSRRSKGDRDGYGPAYLIVGIHDDHVINHWKGVNYPIMNIFERGLCVLQCRYINTVVFSAPFTPSKTYLNNLPFGTPHAVYHGPTAFIPLTYDPYVAAKDLRLYNEIGSHDFQHVNAEDIVQRILRSRQMYEERQKKKGEKAAGEDAVRRRELMEQDAVALDKERAVKR
ncbi:MAG: hypothetical protein Q9218_000204 [Villophora microphyllina]